MNVIGTAAEGFPSTVVVLRERADRRKEKKGNSHGNGKPKYIELSRVSALNAGAFCYTQQARLWQATGSFSR